VTRRHHSTDVWHSAKKKKKTQLPASCPRKSLTKLFKFI